jgi:DNA-binding GntR family transcriptional regulator
LAVKRHSRAEASPARVGAQRVARELARAIEKGELEPGQRLKEQELADRFGLSRAPIREALRLLESQGLAIIEEMRGARVVRPEDADFREIWLIRAALSGVVAELVAASPDAKAKQRFLDQTRALAEKARNGAEARVIYDGLRANTRTLGEITLSTRAQAMLLGLAAGREAFQMRALGTVARRIEATGTWVKLAEAALAGDGPAAAACMQTLYRNSMRFVTSAEAEASGEPAKS